MIFYADIIIQIESYKNFFSLIINALSPKVKIVIWKPDKQVWEIGSYHWVVTEDKKYSSVSLGLVPMPNLANYSKLGRGPNPLLIQSLNVREMLQIWVDFKTSRYTVRSICCGQLCDISFLLSSKLFIKFRLLCIVPLICSVNFSKSRWWIIHTLDLKLA